MLVGRNGQERRIDDFGRQFRAAYFTGGRVKTADVNALAVTSTRRQTFIHIGEAGVSTEVNKQVLTLSAAPNAPGTDTTAERRKKRKYFFMSDLITETVPEPLNSSFILAPAS